MTLLRSRHPFSKRADGGPESAFEQTFAEMAIGYVKDRAPRLGDFITGFQLIDRDTDGSRAVGVFGAKAGDAWMFVPVFFLGGKVKGQELLWLKQSGTFVPNKESWVNAVIARRPYQLGDATDDPRPQNPFMPNFRRVTRPWEYNLKYSAEGDGPAAGDPLALSRFPAWVRPFARVYAHAKLAALAPLELPALLRRHKAAAAARELYRRYPWFKAAFDRHYPGEMAKLAAGLAPPLLRLPAGLGKTAAAKTAALRVVHYTSETVVAPADFSDSEKTRLLTEGRVIADRRSKDKVSKVYSAPGEFASSNPPSTGRYDLLSPDGGRAEATVLRSLYPSDGPQAALVIPAKGSARYAEPKNLWTVGPGFVDPAEARKDFAAWFESLKDVRTPKKGRVYVAVGPEGEATYAFRVTGKDGDACEIDWCPPGEAAATPRPQGLGPEGSRSFGLAGHGTLHLGSARNRLVWAGGGLSVPAAYKLVEIDYDYGAYPAGRPEDVDAAFGKRANLSLFAPRTGPVRVTSGGHTWHADRATVKLALVFQHGLDEATADAAIARAAAAGDVTRFWVKYAAGSGLGPAPGPQIPYFPEPVDESESLVHNPVVTRQSFDEDVPSVGPEYPPGSEWYPPDQKALLTAQNAARSGQKDVFDVGALTSLLRRPVDDDDVGNMMRTLNDLGTKLFQLYAHYEEFEEKYTKDDLPEYEDGLRNVFEGLGDVTLFEQTRDSRGTPGLSAGTAEAGPDLGDLARS